MQVLAATNMDVSFSRRTLLAAGLAFAISPASATPAGRYNRLFSSEAFADRSRFPVGVWLQSPSNAAAWKECGINLYVGLWKGPTEAQLAALASAEMPVIAAQNELALSPRYRDIIVGWLAEPDEPDNAQRILGTKFHGSPISPIEMQRRYREMRRRDPSRPVLLNLGQGVAWDQWHGRGWRTNHPEDYPHYAAAADIVSFDIYPVTSKYPDVAGRIEFVGRGVQRLRQWTRHGQGVWAVIGASRIGNEMRKPSPFELRAQAFMALVHGADGIVWFAHQFAPHFIEAAALKDRETRDGLARVNAEIQALAPILNLGRADSSVKLENGDAIALRPLRYEDALYVLCINKSSVPVQARFSLPQRGRVTDLSSGLTWTSSQAGQVTVLFEGYEPRVLKIEQSG